MSDYRVADGHGVVYGSQTALSPQPKSQGVRYTRQSFALDGTPINEGLYDIWEWTALTEAQYDQIMSDFGLTSAASNDVSINARDENWNYDTYDGKAIKPQTGIDKEWDYFPRNVRILIRGLVAQ